MNLKNKLKEQAKKVLSTQTELVEVSNNPIVLEITEIDKITLDICSNLQELNEIKDFMIVKKQQAAQLRENIIKSLIYVRDHKKVLLTTSFENYLEKTIGITKGYFYEQVQAYELCQQYQLQHYFSEIDYKILVYIARVKDKETQQLLIKKAPMLTRDLLKQMNIRDINMQLFHLHKKQVKCKVENNEVHLTFQDSLSEKDIKEIISFLEKKYQIS